MISIGGRQDAGGDDIRDRLPRRVGESKAASSVCTASGLRIKRSVISVAMPSVPSEPTKHAGQVVAGAIDGVAAQVHHLAIGQHHPRPSTWLTVKPYLRQCAPPEFSATLPPMEQTCWLDGIGRVVVAVRRDRCVT